MSIGAIIQARLGSTRLPNKVLMDIEGKPMLQRVIDRVRESEYIDSIAIAVPSSDQELAQLAMGSGIGFFAHDGDENDVLDRYYRAASFYKADPIVRITADCPLIDPQVIDKVIERYLTGHFDYVSNMDFYPDGLDTEVFSSDALRIAWVKAETPRDREHVTSYMYSNPELLRIGSIRYKRKLPYYHWSVNVQKDLDFVRWVYQKLGDRFYLEDILELVSG